MLKSMKNFTEIKRNMSLYHRGFQSVDYLDINENRILNVGKINFVENMDINNKTKISNREEELLAKIKYKNSSKNRKELVKELVIKNSDIFWLEGDELGTCN